jgi:hypothetical protein
VTRTGRVLAVGGAGGRGPDHSFTQLQGGGGSGGAIYLAAPAISLFGEVRAQGGEGGRGNGCGNGGSGGLGRVRLSVDPVRCEVTGTSVPPVPTGCAPSPDGGVPGQAYVGAWPN